MKRKNLCHYGVKNIGGYMLSLVMIALSSLSLMIAPTLLAEIIDEVIVKGNMSAFPRLLILLALFYILPGIFGYIEEVTSDSISRKVCSELRRDVFSSISLQDSSFFSSHSPSDLMSRTTSDTESIGEIFGFCGIFIVEIIAVVVSQFCALMRVNRKCALVPLAALPLIAVLAYRSEAKGDRLSDAISDKRADLNETVSEAVRGIRTVKSFGREEKEKERFRREAGLFRNISRSFDYLWVHWCTPESVIAIMMVPLTVLIGGREVIEGRMTIGELAASVQYTNELSWPMMEIGWLFIAVSSARAGWRKIRAIMESECEIKDGEKSLDTSHGTMKFNSVSLRGGGRTLLDDISFTIEPGKTVALMGASGSGKSLITSLAVRFLDPTKGSVTIDGVDLRDMTLSSVRAFSSVVSEDVFLFSDTVANNIALGKRKSYDEEEMKTAARKAEAADFIEKLENGWNTVIGERGVGLSGGQKQRLCIARAFMRHSQLLILDDVTSSLDMKTEKKIERTIRRNKGRSLLITAHRISALRSADEIIVLDGGRIAERGRHEELLEKKGLYWKTYISQYPEEEKR